MRSFLLCWIVVSTSFPAFPQVIKSNVYSANQLPAVNQRGYEEQTLLEGTTRDFSHLVIQAITLGANQPGQPAQELDEEAVLIVKAGELTLTLGGKRKILGPASVVMIMPGDEYRVENKTAQSLSYYLMRYTSNEMPDLDLYQLVGSSFWIDWKEIVSAADQHGGSQRVVTCSSVMSSRIAMQVTTIRPGLKTYALHTHRAAELILVQDHPVQARIEGALKMAQVGDLIFVESEISHAIQNSSQEGSTYLSLQF